jgi:hypothetical protein
MIGALPLARRDTRFRTKASSVVFFLFRNAPTEPSARSFDTTLFFLPTARIFWSCPNFSGPHTLPPGPPSQHKCACWDSRSREIEVPRHESPRSVPNFLGFSGPGCGSPATGQTSAMRVPKVARPKCNLMTVGSAGFYYFCTVGSTCKLLISRCTRFRP